MKGRRGTIHGTPPEREFLGSDSYNHYAPPEPKLSQLVELLNEIKQESDRSYVQGYTFALIYIGLGDKQEH